MDGLHRQAGIDRDEALNAMLNYFAHFPQFDDSRSDRTVRRGPWIGPPRQRGAPLLEVVTVTARQAAPSPSHDR